MKNGIFIQWLFKRACEAGCCQRFSWNPADVRWSSLPGCWSCPERWGPGSPARHAQAANSLPGLTALGWASLQIAGSATQPATKTRHKFHQTYPNELNYMRKTKERRDGLQSPVLLTISILFSFIMMRAHRKKANMSLCFSNKLRHTLLYKLKVKYSLMLAILLSTVSVRQKKSVEAEEYFQHLVTMS